MVELPTYEIEFYEDDAGNEPESTCSLRSKCAAEALTLWSLGHTLS